MKRWAIVGLVMGWASVALGGPYQVVPLGELRPADVNESGQVIGLVGGNPYLWTDGALVPMQHLGRGGKPVRFSEAAEGVSVGEVGNPSGPGVLAAQWDASGALILLYTRDPLAGSTANGQNKKGLTSGFGGRPDAIYGGPVSSAMRWDSPQRVTLMDTQDGQWSEAVGIDDHGQVWGLDNHQQVVRWDTHGRISPVPDAPLGATIYAVSGRGVAVGVGLNLADFSVFAVSATKQGFARLPQLAGAQCTPVDVNRWDTIIGNCWMPDGALVPVRWMHGRIEALSLDVPPGVRSFQLTGLSDTGVLVGAGAILDDSGPFPVSRTAGFLFRPLAQTMVRR